MRLRPYQVECLSAVRRADIEGCRRQLIVLPTGTGKTKIASHVPETIGLHPPQKMAFIVAQEELCWQAKDALTESNPGMNVTVEKAEHRLDPTAHIAVASVDTLARSEPRLTAFASLPWRVIFIDEAHGAVSPKYLKVLRKLQVLKGEPDNNPSRLLIGLTATPKRFDGIALGSIFDRIVFRRDIRQMIADGWIVDPIAYRVDTGLLMDDLSIRNGDFATGELSRKMNTPRINDLIVKTYLEYGNRLPAIAFTVDIQHSEELARTFRKHGLDFEPISSDTPKQRRKELIDAHRRMQLLGLVSCQALLTGFDSPPATVALFARPTCSGLLYTQAIGRVLRPYPAPEQSAEHSGYRKTNAIIIDFVGATSKFRLYTASVLFGLHQKFDIRGKSITETLEQIESIQQKYPSIDMSLYEDLSSIQAATTRVDLWKPSPIPKLAKTHSQFVWMQVTEDRYRLALPGMAIYVEQNHLGEFEVYCKVNRGEVQALLRFSQPEDAFSYADSLVPDELVALVRANARWRNDPPKQSQCEHLWWRDPSVREQFTSGEAFYRYALSQFLKGNAAFSKGNISCRIDQCKIRSRVKSLSRA
jgi:ATP-dependent helicase IRC3